MKKQITQEKARTLFKERGGVLRTGEAVELGINSKTLYTMRKNGEIQTIDRGIYLLVDDDINIEHIDMLIAHKRAPKSIICLISALSFHHLTTQIPHHVYIALQQGWREPTFNFPPIKTTRYSKASFDSGIEYHEINGIQIPIYSAAKTVVDCFKFRNKVGLDVAIQALNDYWKKNQTSTVDELLKYAKICRVVNVMTPYIHSMTQG